jgi:hypothetical protein
VRSNLVFALDARVYEFNYVAVLVVLRSELGGMY